MITHCLECDTYFRVSVEQLKTANGQVKCGCCMTVFNALESLLDNSDSESENTEPSHEETIGAALLNSDKEIADQIEKTVPEETSNTEETFIQESGEQIDEVPEVLLESTVDTEEVLENTLDEIGDFEEISTSDPQTEIYTETEKLIDVSDEHEEEESNDAPLFGITIEEELVELNELQEPQQKQTNWVWICASTLMIFLLMYQFIYFNTQSTLERFPSLGFLCGVLDCPVSEEKLDVSSINLISRDVRDHPQFVDVLLINATLMNSAKTRKPFPRMQLDLYDKVGRSIGSRQFEPEEYLDSSIDLDVGMKPELPVHIVLEIMGSGEVANSFEFTFLE